MKRLATLEDVENAVEFFASPKSSYVTGQVLHLGGV
jgi:NAD(P)-dependent dehydrogenase (short-subunit alcohol dehydrogenase family)